MGINPFGTTANSSASSHYKMVKPTLSKHERNNLVLAIMRRVIETGKYTRKVDPPKRPAEVFQHNDVTRKCAWDVAYDMAQDMVIIGLSYSYYEKMPNLSELERYVKLREDIEQLVALFNLTTIDNVTY